MKKLPILLFIISIFSLGNIIAQQKQDTIKRTKSFALRVGIDISKPIRSIFEKDFKGIEITADANIYKNFFLAAELGFDKKTTAEDYLNFTTDGSYAKLGVNYNAYKNWIGMNNQIFVGIRYGFSSFKQTLNSYTPNVYGTVITTKTITPNTTFSNLNAHWTELVLGLKVETFKNIYLGAQVSLKKMISTKEPDNFKNLYVPGFSRVFSNNVGVNFNYTISYLIPIKKKK